MPNNPLPQNPQNQIVNQYKQPQPSPQLPTPPTKIPWHILDKRMIIPIVVIILLIGAAFLVRYFFFSGVETVEQPAPKAPEIPNPIEDCRALSRAGDDAARDKCLFDKAIETRSVLFCEEMLLLVGPISMNSCYSKLAVQLDFIDYCYLTDRIYGEYSFSSCILNISLAEGNPNRCLLLNSGEDKYSISHCASQFNLTEEDLTKLYGPVPG